MRLLIAALALAIALPVAAQAQDQSLAGMSDMTPKQRDAFRAEVRAYLLEHPEVLKEAIDVLQQRQADASRKADAELISQYHDQIFNDGTSWVGGNPKGDVTLVEFTDYRCGYCKRSHPEVAALLKDDPNIRLVVKEFPILGPDSLVAARMALAALDIDPSKYGELNDALMSFEGQLTEPIAYKIAAHVGYDAEALQKRAEQADIEDKIRENYSLAKELGIEGTPGFVVGKRILRGYLPKAGMAAMVAEARDTTN